jgi:hypothetical protein
VAQQERFAAALLAFSYIRLAKTVSKAVSARRVETVHSSQILKKIGTPVRISLRTSMKLKSLANLKKAPHRCRRVWDG